MLMNTYARFPLTLVKGEGAYLYDDQGKKYLDFTSGIGVNSIGHAHPKWTKALTEQLNTLSHTSNLYHTKPAQQLAQKLKSISGLESVFFANSGAEANEGLIKMARKYSHDKYGKNRSTIVTLNQSFHGRTVTTLSACGQDNLHQNFEPFTEGFVHVPANDLKALKSLGDSICAILLEPIQGEGGINPLSEAYVQQVAALCQERDWLLLFDEVQTGIGRTGKWFGFQHVKGVQPDGISFAKGIGGGFPLGGFLAGKKCAQVLGPGDHGSTYGGNPLACTAGLATLSVLEAHIQDITAKGDYLEQQMNSLTGLSTGRGAGLMWGFTVEIGTAKTLTEALTSNGLLCLTAGGNTLRLLPALTITYEQIDEAVEIIKKTMSTLQEKQTKSA